MDGEANGSWPSVRLGEVAQLIMGQAPAGATVAEWDGAAGIDRGLPFIQGNAEFGPRFPSPVKWCRQPSKIALPGDYLISVRAPVGELNEVNTKLAIGRGLAAIRFRSVHDRFGWQALWRARGEFARVAQGSTFDAINSRDLAGLLIPCPPEPVQISIACTLDAIDEAIGKTEAVIAATEDLRKALLQEMLTRGVPGWHTEWKTVPGIGSIPACWDVVRLGEVAEVTSGIALGPARAASQNPVRYLTVANVQTDRIDLGEPRFMELTASEMNTRLLRVGDVLMVEGHANVTQLGRCALASAAAEGLTFQNHLFRIRGLADRLLNGFLAVVVNGPVGRHYFEQFGGTTSGLNTVSSSNVKRLQTPLPSLREQEQIVASVADIRAREDCERRQLDGQRRLKAWTSEALLSGRVRVPKAEDSSG